MNVEYILRCLLAINTSSFVLGWSKGNTSFVVFLSILPFTYWVVCQKFLCFKLILFWSIVALQCVLVSAVWQNDSRRRACVSSVLGFLPSGPHRTSGRAPRAARSVLAGHFIPSVVFYSIGKKMLMITLTLSRNLKKSAGNKTLLSLAKNIQKEQTTLLVVVVAAASSW